MTEKKLRAIVSNFGAEIDEQSFRNGTLNIDAPAGQVWMGNGCHTICEVFENLGGQSWKRQAFADAVDAMEYGLEACEDKDCDVCQERGAR